MIEAEAIAVAILGAGGALLGILGLMRPHWTKHRLFQLAPMLLAGTASAFAFAGGSPLLALVPLGLVAFWMVVSFGDEILRIAAHVVTVVRHPRLAWGTLFLACPLLALGWSHWTIAPENFWEPPQIRSVATMEVAHGKIRTDAGRVLRVATPVRAATAAELREVERQNALPNLICTDRPGVDYNCHGWVFTGGRYWVYVQEVKQILQDNGYVRVSAPAAGDIIIYYDTNNEPVHTGLVRSADERGIIIESKWDIRGRYIHLPEAQDYATTWVYYHSDRNGHLLAGIETAPNFQAVSVKTRTSN